MRVWCKLLLAASAAAVCAQPAAQPIGVIDFYGYGTLDPARLRAVLPFREGDPLPSDKLSAQARTALQKASGRSAIEISSPVLGNGHWTVYIGLAEPDAPPVRYNPQPTDDTKLPPDAVKIFDRLDKDLFAAVKNQTADEDDSAGYALIKDPATRRDQLKLHEWARAHTDTLYRILESSRHSDHRARAAEGLGYADHSPAQIAGLVGAAFDVDAGVRNAAIRALSVLCALGAETIRQIPAARFIPMLHSLHWTDRNKASWLFLKLTEGRDPDLLRMLREQALGPLREMVQWRNQGHAFNAAMILGRMAGFADGRTVELLNAGDIGAILKAVR